MLHDFDGRTKQYLDEITKKYNIYYQNDRIRQEIIDAILSGGTQKEDYFTCFQALITIIKKEYGHLRTDSMQIESIPVGIEKYMNILWKIEPTKGLIKRKKYIICSIAIKNYRIDRRSITERYP